MKVFVTTRLPEDIVSRISETHEVAGHVYDEPVARERLLEAVSDRDAILCSINDVIDMALLGRAPAVKIVSNIGVGYNNIDVDEASKRGILVTNTPGVLTDATADLTLALILAVSRRIVEGDRMVREGRFRFWGLFHFLGHELSGKRLGIIGMGRIGQAVAARAAAFGMKILYHSRRRVPPETERALNASFSELDALLSGSDFISLHTPLSAETRHLVSGRELSLMKKSAFLINTSRGAVVDEKALLDALRGGAIAGAGMDVYENEPDLTPGLTDLPNVVLLPHMGSATQETRRRMASMAVDNLLAGLSGKLPPNCVNPPVSWEPGAMTAKVSLIPIDRDGTPRGFSGSLPEAAVEVFRGTAALYERAGFEEPWICYFALADKIPVGTCGFKAKPQNGRVEIAYFTFPEFEGRGYASAMAGQLLAIARVHDSSVVVAAQTLPVRNASHRILEKLGFRHVDTIDHPEDGTVREWQLNGENGF